MGRNGMGRNGYGPKWSWAEMVMGRNDPEPYRYTTTTTYLTFGYRFPCRADNAAYPHDGRADKRRYRHDRLADSQCLHPGQVDQVPSGKDRQNKCAH